MATSQLTTTRVSSCSWSLETALPIFLVRFVSRSIQSFRQPRSFSPFLAAVASSLITEVNFTVTRSGLEGQLLGITLHHEKPELEKKKSALLAEEESLKIQLAELEKLLLQELANSEGNILENKSLLDSLNKVSFPFYLDFHIRVLLQTKTQSIQIATALTNAKGIQADLDKQREVYRPIANSGSLLYFLVAQLSAVNNMYEFSLNSFLRLFNSNLGPERKGSDTERKAAPDKDEKDRVRTLSEGLKLIIFHYVSRSLFKADRLMFGMHLVHCLMPQLFGKFEWELFTGAFVNTDDKV